MTHNAVLHVGNMIQKEHLERQDALAVQQYIEDVANNMRTFQLNKERNAIEKLANDQLNSRELEKLAWTIQNDTLNLLEKEKSRLSNEEIEAAKREIEKEANNIKRLQVESENNLRSKQPQFEKDRNEATIKAGLYRGLGGLGATLAAVVTKVGGKGANIAKGMKLESMLRSLTKTSPKGVSTLLKDLTATAAKSGVGASILSLTSAIPYAAGSALIWKISDAINDSEWAKRNTKNYQGRQPYRSNPSNATRYEDPDEDEIPSDPGRTTMQEAKQTYLQEKGINLNLGGNNNETASQQTQKYEVSGDRGETSGSSGQISQSGYIKLPSAEGSGIYISPGAATTRDFGPGIS